MEERFTYLLIEANSKKDLYNLIGRDYWVHKEYKANRYHCFLNYKDYCTYIKECIEQYKEWKERERLLTSL
jgi:hypothetical protein